MELKAKSTNQKSDGCKYVHMYGPTDGESKSLMPSHYYRGGGIKSENL